MTDYCAFHILTSQYVYCHIGNMLRSGVYFETPTKCFLLPLGSTYDYDTPTIMLRYPSEEELLNKLRHELSDPSLAYKNRCIEEFEVHEFTEKLVPLHHRWKEYHNDGTIKATWER